LFKLIVIYVQEEFNSLRILLLRFELKLEPYSNEVDIMF